MERFDDATLQSLRAALHWPSASAARFSGSLPVVVVPVEWFPYSPDVGYAFETACMEHVASGECILFIRIDAWDPIARAQGSMGRIDYVIPVRATASPEMPNDVRRRIPFGGQWSDARPVALLAFDASWTAFMVRVADRLAFANPGSPTAACMILEPRHRRDLDRFVGRAMATE
ncbi:MAG: hypothetical protein NZ898_16510 [Myxococcota bacterium]|nr:hypothetical protein [Myxococcota bacterium]MDW8363133.1 hypothetical protein [Myxococcales bacterium]